MSEKNIVEYSIVAVAIGKATHIVISMNGTDEPHITYVANSIEGVQEVLALSNITREVTIGGNRRWGTPFAAALRTFGRSVYYLPIKEKSGARGRRGSIAKTMQTALQNGVRGNLFFSEFKPPRKYGEETQKSVQIARQYLQTSNDMRRLKHRINDALAMVCPELVPAKTTTKKVGDQYISMPIPMPLPPDTFGKRMFELLRNPTIAQLTLLKETPDHVKTIVSGSIAQYMDPIVRQQENKKLVEHLAQYEKLQVSKERWVGELQTIFPMHPALDAFNGSKTVLVLLGLIAWRKWPEWRELRHFAGLAVTRLNSDGKPAINGARGEIRQYLYLIATTTGKGKELVGTIKHKIKKIEKLLKFFWREYLR